MTDYDFPLQDMAPNDKASEQAILGAIILNNQIFAEVRAALPREAFYGTAHKLIYEAMCHLADKDQPIDEVTIGNALKQREAVDVTGGFAYLSELTRSTPVVDNVSHYSGIVADCWKKREIIRFFDQTRQILDHASSGQLISQAREFFEGISKGGDKSLSKQAQDFWVDFTNDLDLRCQGISNESGFKTGLPSFDELTGGLVPSHTYVIAARPAMGKSAFALNLALRMCGMLDNVEMPAPALVLFMSLEMKNNETASRMASILGGISHDLIQNPSMMTAEDWDALSLATSKVFQHETLYVSDIGGITVQQIESEVYKKQSIASKQFGGRMVLFIDYLQLMKSENTKNKREDQLIGEITSALKLLAIRLNIAVVELAQLNRNLESRLDKRPVLSDLRGSGNIEQDANCIIALNRPGVYNDEIPMDQIEISIIKNRSGKTGTANLVFDGDKQRFREYRFGELPTFVERQTESSSNKKAQWGKR